MMDILLYKNGKYKFVDADMPISKKDRDEVKALLIKCTSEILGDFYVPVKYKFYKRFMNRVESMYLKYTFMDGEDVGDPEQIYYDKITFTDEFKSLRSFLTKFNEIGISEFSLNDIFWVHSAFIGYNYEFKNIKVKFKSKNKKTKYSIEKFLNEFIGIDKDVFTDSVDIVNKNEYLLITRLKDVSGKNLTLIRMYNDVFVPTDSKFITSIESIEYSMKLYLGDEGIDYEKLDRDELEDLLWRDIYINEPKFKKKWIQNIREIYQIPMHLHVLNNMIYTPDKDYLSTYTKFKTKVVFKDNSKKKMKWQELYNQIFNTKLEVQKKEEKEVEFVLKPKNGLAKRLSKKK